MGPALPILIVNFESTSDVKVTHRMGGAGLREQIRLRHDFHLGMLRHARGRWGEADRCRS